MAIQVTCTCGNLLQAKDEWAGRRAECPKCKAVVVIPGASPGPARSGGLDDLFDEEFSRSPSSGGASPFAPGAPLSPPGAPQPKPKGGWFSWLFWKFPSFGDALRWNEPAWFPVRLRGDMPWRFAIILAAWAAGTGVFLTLFAINNNPPGIPLAVGLGAICGGVAMMFMFMRRAHSFGKVSVSKEGIHRNVHYASLTTGWHEWFHWPRGSVRQCVLVPADRLGKSFSVMLLDSSDRHLVGVPRSVDLEELRRRLAELDVPVAYGHSVPAEYTRPLDLKIPLAVGAVCAVCFLFGLGFYVLNVGDRQGGRDEAERVAEAQRARMQEMMNKSRLESERMRSEATRFPMRSKARQQPPAGLPGMSGGDAPKDETDDALQPGGNQPPMPRLGPGFGGMGGRFPRGDAGSMMDPAGRLPLGGRSPGPGQGGDGSNRPQPSFGPRSRAGGPQMPSQPGDTELVGGSGGAPFRSTSSTGGPVLGFRYTMGSWAGQAALGTLVPVFERPASGGPGQMVVARDGYAVGAIQVAADQLVNAVQVVFMRVEPDGRLDTNDSYTSEWIGEPAGKTSKQLGGTGAPVMGVYGRKALVLDALGLVMQTQ